MGLEKMVSTVDDDFVERLVLAAQNPEPLQAALSAGRLLIERREACATFSLRALDRDERCTVPRRTLRTYLAVAEQWEELGDALGARLPLSIHVELLPVSDPVRKRTLAIRAADGEWTVKQLRAEAAAWIDRRGRPVHRARLRRLAKNAENAAETTAQLLQTTSARESMDKLAPSDAEEVAAALERTRAQLGELAARLRTGAAERSRAIEVAKRRAVVPRLDKYDRLKSSD